MNFAALRQIAKSPVRSTLARSVGNALPSGALDYLMDWGPDIAMGGLYAASLPSDYASGFERAGVGLEDSVLGIGGSALGRAVATAAGLTLGMRPRAAAQMGGWVGGMGGGMGLSMFGPRPFGSTLQARSAEMAEQMQKERDQAMFSQGLQQAAQSPPIQALDFLTGGYG